MLERATARDQIIRLFLIHGSDTSNAPQLVQALAPVVAVLDNGPRKGGSAQSYKAVIGAPGTPDVWQLHRALTTALGDSAGEERIAGQSVYGDRCPCYASKRDVAYRCFHHEVAQRLKGVHPAW